MAMIESCNLQKSLKCSGHGFISPPNFPGQLKEYSPKVVATCWRS